MTGDLLDLDRLSAAISGPNTSYNFAALASLNEALSKPLETVGSMCWVTPMYKRPAGRAVSGVSSMQYGICL